MLTHIRALQLDPAFRCSRKAASLFFAIYPSAVWAGSHRRPGPRRYHSRFTLRLRARCALARSPYARYSPDGPRTARACMVHRQAPPLDTARGHPAGLSDGARYL